MYFLPWLLLAAIGGLCAAPLGQLVLTSLSSTAGEWTLRHYAEILQDKYVQSALLQTLAFCGGTAAVATLLSLPAAWWIAKSKPGHSTLRLLCQVNYAFGGVVYGMLMVTLLGNAGVLTMLEKVLFGASSGQGYAYTVLGLTVAYLGFQTPRAALLMAQAIERIDPQLVRAATVLGAAPRQTLLMILMPLLSRSLALTYLATALISLASFGTALLIAKSLDIFAVLIFREFTGYGEFHRAAAMGVVLAACCLLLDVLARRVGNSTGPLTATLGAKN